ncbi:MAG: hypothetical protein R3E79_36130 [Caldilineaceae bacterium]
MKPTNWRNATLSFCDLEQIWATEVLPKLSEFKTMQYLGCTPLG